MQARSPRAYPLRVGKLPKVSQGLLFELLNLPSFYKFIPIPLEDEKAALDLTLTDSAAAAAAMAVDPAAAVLCVAVCLDVSPATLRTRGGGRRGLGTSVAL